MNIDAVFEICKGLRNEKMKTKEMPEIIAKDYLKHVGTREKILAQAYLALQKKQKELHSAVMDAKHHNKRIVAQAYLGLLKKHEEAEEVWVVFKEAAKIEIKHAKKEYKELLEMQGICNVCTGKPINGRPCICRGAGTQTAELQGLRERVFELESLLKKQEGHEQLKKFYQVDSFYDLIEAQDGHIGKLQAKLKPQEGMVLVPEEPTEEEGNIFFDRYFDDDVWRKANHTRVKAGLEAMIAKEKQ